MDSIALTVKGMSRSKSMHFQVSTVHTEISRHFYVMAEIRKFLNVHALESLKYMRPYL
jgi:hypothetical protein